jgi:hypothetical protein
MEQRPNLLPHSLNDLPADLTLSETLHKLVQELSHCVETLRETHELVAPQLAELEQRYPHARTKRDDQRSLGRASSSYPA